MAASTTDYDSPWKEALDFYLRDFLRLLAPWLHAQIDWSHPPVFLDKELQAIARQGLRGRLYADKLVQVVSKRRQPLCVDWMMALPANLEPAFEQAMIAMEQEHKMAFVTSIERLGEKRGWEKGLNKGLRKGRQEGQACLLQRQLTRKFGPLPETVRQRLQSATPAQLETWSLNILDAQTLKEVFVE